MSRAGFCRRSAAALPPASIFFGHCHRRILTRCSDRSITVTERGAGGRCRRRDPGREALTRAAPFETPRSGPARGCRDDGAIAGAPCPREDTGRVTRSFAKKMARKGGRRRVFATGGWKPLQSWGSRSFFHRPIAALHGARRPCAGCSRGMYKICPRRAGRRISTISIDARSLLTICSAISPAPSTAL